MLSKGTRNLIVETATLLLLPHHESSVPEIDEMIEYMKKCLRQTSRPAIITIARSTSEWNNNQKPTEDDGYTRRDEADMIQHKVVAAIQDLLAGDSGRCKWGEDNHALVTHRFYELEEEDTGEEDRKDAYTMAYGMFLNDGANKEVRKLDQAVKSTAKKMREG